MVSYEVTREEVQAMSCASASSTVLMNASTSASGSTGTSGHGHQNSTASNRPPWLRRGRVLRRELGEEVRAIGQIA